MAELGHLRRGMVIAIATCAVVTALLAPGLSAMGEKRSSETPQDVIVARKSLMNAVEENSDRIARMISERDINLPEARARAGSMFVLLTALPHLFPPESNQWKEGADLDPVTDTVASPEIWTDFAEFYKLASAAAKRADELRHATSEEEVKSLHRALGNLCDLCHALYYKE